MRRVFIFAFSVDGAVIYIYYTGCMFLFSKKEILLLLFVQILKTPGKSWNFVKTPGKFLEIWCKKSWKKWKKVLENSGKFWNLHQFFWWEPCLCFGFSPAVTQIGCIASFLRYFCMLKVFSFTMQTKYSIKWGTRTKGH